MSGTYSIGTWLVKPGREAEFISTWQDLALWTEDKKVGASEGTLVQDLNEPRRFYCFWPFDSEAGVDQLRNDPKFREFMMRLRAYSEDHHPIIARRVGSTSVAEQLAAEQQIPERRSPNTAMAIK